MPPPFTHICPLFDPEHAKKLPYSATLQTIGAAVDSLKAGLIEIRTDQKYWFQKVEAIAGQVADHEKTISTAQIAHELAQTRRADRRQRLGAIASILGGLVGIGGLIHYFLPLTRWLLR